MSDRVVLDANVLYPFSLRDTLLRLAEMELYDCLWSAQILEEATRNLVKDRRISSEGAGRLAGAMNAAFEDAQVDAEAIAALEGSMTNDAKDRHVLAAAVAGEASSLVTQNLKHFPASAATPFAITVVSPDEFLVLPLRHRLTGRVGVPCTSRRPAESFLDGPRSPRRVGEDRCDQVCGVRASRRQSADAVIRRSPPSRAGG